MTSVTERPEPPARLPDPIVAEDSRRVLARCAPELETLAGRTLLMTGGSGFFGATFLEVVREWNARNPHRPCNVLLPTRSVQRTTKRWPQFANEPTFRWFEWDGASPRAGRADYVVHAAGPAHGGRSPEAQLATARALMRSTEAVGAWAKEAGVRRALALSSGAVYGDVGERRPIREQDFAPSGAERPPTDYAGAKRAAEAIWLASGVPTVVARPFAFVGPYQDLNAPFAFPDLLQQATQSDRVRLRSDGSALRTFAYASDLAVVLLKLLVNGAPGEAYNVGSPGPSISIMDLARLVLDATGARDGAVEVGPSPDPARRWYVPDTSKIAAFISPEVGLRTGVERTIRSMRARGILPPPPGGSA